jgi:chromosome segregation ATPase
VNTAVGTNTVKGVNTGVGTNTVKGVNTGVGNSNVTKNTEQQAFLKGMKLSNEKSKIILNALQKKNSQKSAVMRMLLARTRRLLTLKTEKESKISNLEKIIKNKNSSATELSAAKNALEKEMKNLRNAESAAKNQIENLKKQVLPESVKKQMSENLEATRAQLNSLTAQSKNLSTQLTFVTQQKNYEIEELKGSLREHALEVNKLRKNAEEAKTELDKAKRNFENSSEKNKASAIAEVNAARAELAAVMKQLTNAKEEANRIRKNATTSNAEKAEELGKLRAEMNVLKKASNSLSESQRIEINSVRKELEKAKLELVGASNKASAEAEANRQAAQNKLEQVKRELDQAKANANAHKQQIQQSTLNRNEKISELAKVSKQLDDIRKAKEETNTALSSAKVLIAKHQESATLGKAELAREQQSREELLKLKNNHSAKSEKEKEELRLKIANLESRRLLSNINKKKISEYNKQIKFLKEELKGVNAKKSRTSGVVIRALESGNSTLIKNALNKIYSSGAAEISRYDKTPTEIHRLEYLAHFLGLTPNRDPEKTIQIIKNSKNSNKVARWKGNGARIKSFESRPEWEGPTNAVRKKAAREEEFGRPVTPKVGNPVQGETAPRIIAPRPGGGGLTRLDGGALVTKTTGNSYRKVIKVPTPTHVTQAILNQAIKKR